MTTMPSDDAVREALREVDDPEADLTMTTAACPMTDMIVDQVREVVTAIVPVGTTVDVRLVWDPPWTPDKMTGIAREHFGWTF